MAITQETVNSTAVVQFSSDGDDYDDLLTEKPNITSVFNLDDNLPQITRLNKALYFPNGIGAEFKNAFLVLDPGAAIAVQSLNTTLASMEDANRTGPRFVDSMICINSSDDAGPDSIGDQLPAQYYNNNGSWVSVNKVQIAPLQIANTTLVFTTSENNTNNGLVMSYSVGDGTGACKIIWDASLVSTNDRLFIGAGARIINTDIFNCPKITFNDIAKNLPVQNFDGVRIIGSSIIDQQGLTIYKGTRFIDNTKTSDIMIGFYGSSRTPRRASACYINMTFLIDGGVTSSNTAFALIQKESNSNLTGTKRLFLNEYDLIVKNPSGDGIEDVSIIGFLKKGAGGDVTHETALDFSEKYRSHAYDTNRYGVVSDDNFANAGQNIETRLDDNFSLDGEEELVTNSDGDTIVSGETDITRLQFRVVEIAFNGTTAGFDRTNFSEHKIRISKYGKIGQDIDIPVGFDTNDNAANRIQNLVMVDDARITEPVKSTVAAYATLTNLNEFYDYIRHLEFENRKDPNLRRISFDGKSITFPSNSTIDVDTSQTDPITVSYSSADSTVFTLKNDSQITVPGNNNLNSLDLGTDGTVDSDADFATSVGIIDSSGLSVVLNCNIASVKIHYQIDPDDDGSDDIEGYVTADSSGNYKLTGIPSESHVYVAAKKDGYDYFVTDFDPAVTISKSLILSLTQSVDLSVSVSDYTFDSGATDSDNNIFFEYDGAGKSNIIFGEIDLDPATNARKLSNRVFDHLFETEDGLKFINFWNRDNSITELDGRPYLISNGKISINNTKLEFTRMSGMTAAEKSYFGQYVSDEEDDRYRAPQSNNDNVSIASESNVIESSIGTLEDAAVFIRKEMDDNSTKLEEILEDVSNPVFEHLYVVDNDVHRVLGYDIASKKLNPSIGFDLHTDNENPQGMTNYNGLFYLLNAPATGTQKILVYTSRGNRLEYREFELHADNDSPEAIAIAGEKIYILDGGSTKKIFVYDATTLQRLSGDDIDDLSSIENPQGMDVHGEYAYVSDSRNNIDTTRRLRVYKLSDGVLDTAKSFNLNSNQQLPTGVVVTNSRIRIVDENRDKIYVYLHDGTHISSEDITLDSTNTDARGMAIISSSVNDIATLEADFAGLKTSIDGIFDDAEFIRKMQSSDVEVTDSQIIFSYEGTTLLTFNRRTSTTAADYSGGREIDSS